MTKSSDKTTGGTAPTTAPLDLTGGAALKAWSEMGAEGLRFVTARMQHGMEAQKAMIACKGIDDLQKVQAEFYAKAVADYQAEVARLMALMSAPATGGQAATSIPTKRRYDDVPL